MQDDRNSIPDAIRQKFPRLRPSKGVPALFSINGIGLILYGRRNFDAETKTYVKTRCVCLVYLPLFALDSYRVADTGDGQWVVLGKEPISSLARGWNVFVAGMILWGGLNLGWEAHTSSPEYKAGKALEQAAELAPNEPLRAAGIYHQQLAGPRTTDARKGLADSLNRCLESEDPAKVAGAFNLLGSMAESGYNTAEFVPEAFNRGLTLAEKFRAAKPDGALEVLNGAAQLTTNMAQMTPLRVALLKEIVQAQPDRTNRVVELALIYEAEKQDDACVQLLLPYRAKLGDTEGARILGQNLLRQDQHEAAYQLLFPYVQSRLEKVREIEGSYTNTLAAISRRLIGDLERGRGPQSFYTAYKSASEPEQERLVDEYLQEHMRRDPAYQRMMGKLKEANRIVPVALDLGIVQLNRAQELRDPAARKAELEAAEKTFLAIRGFAGESDEYRLFLGQVYYWLGRSAEGKGLFDELLAANQRSYRMLMAVANVLRDVGEAAAARTLAEEAYASAKESQNKYGAAMFRSLAARDNDDRIVWLSKGNPEDSHTQIELNSARALQSLQAGDKKQAATHARAAIAGYEKQGRTAAMLNNCGLAWFTLYEATGNPADQKRGLAMIEEAIALNPGDSILLMNVTHSLMAQAVMDLVRDQVHPSVLNGQTDLDSLSHLYLNGDQRARIYQQLHDNENYRKSVGYLDKALTLAPKNLGLYYMALSIHAANQDVAELQKLLQRFRTAAPALDEARASTLEHYSGAKDKETLERYQTTIRELEEQLKSSTLCDTAHTRDFLEIALINAQQNAWVYGGTVDSEKLLQAALKAYQRHPTAATRGALLNVYYFRAGEQLARQHPEYAALVQRTRRAISPGNLLTFAVEQGGSLADKVKQNESFQKATALQKEIMAGTPTRVDAADWALFRRVDADAATEAARLIKANVASGLSQELRQQLSPCNGNAVLDEYWAKKFAGDEAGATAVYRNALAAGVPLPPI